MTEHTPLTRSQMRDDIAKLLRMPAGEIGDDDDLGDLGLDSMRAMALLQRWTEGGLPLDFAEMAERPSLAAWWAAAERAQSKD
ncbi:phosphopantetheine-binding protein [Pseudoroseomonas deserti]|uniref:Phosphopantetheine-binding protein n=1 Tax=Teichococcus deserti TaxID=1817963 RepID=A0A1V2GV85_9PROT|nr:phosphopantetheine-binding protein [Pseudoroseomonas deserti]ONG44617.1 phosphopantetheine-binding protein [Pseudoroseomonas deserti]